MVRVVTSDGVCGSCWDSLGRPVFHDEDVEHGAELVRRLYELEPTGGPLHPELDDWNIEAETITPVYEIPPHPGGAAGYPDSYSAEVHQIADELAALLTGMSNGVRGSVLAHAEGWAVNGVVVDKTIRAPGERPQRPPVAPAGADQDQAADAADAAQWLTLERERLTVELADAVAERDKARADVADYEALFDLQWKRTGEATALWRAEAPEERALTMPDLGDLLVWLMARGPARIVAGDVESRCRRCSGVNVPWTAPSPLWNMVMRGGSINGAEIHGGIVCLACFAELAEERHIGDLWRLDATRVNVELETVTPSGRHWDPDTWMWLDGPDTVEEQP